jgi:hypothetical protein
MEKWTKLTVTRHSFAQVLNRSNIERIWKCTKTVMEILTFLFLGGGGGGNKKHKAGKCI